MGRHQALIHEGGAAAHLRCLAVDQGTVQGLAHGLPQRSVGGKGNGGLREGGGQAGRLLSRQMGRVAAHGLAGGRPQL